MSTLRHPLFNLLLGGFFGLCVGAAIASHAAASRIDAMTAKIGQERQEMAELYIAKVAEANHLGEQMAACYTELQHVKAIAWPAQPQQPPDPNQTLYDLANMVRPGLGTAVQKLHRQAVR